MLLKSFAELAEHYKPQVKPAKAIKAAASFEVVTKKRTVKRKAA